MILAVKYQLDHAFCANEIHKINLSEASFRTARTSIPLAVGIAREPMVYGAQSTEPFRSMLVKYWDANRPHSTSTTRENAMTRALIVGAAALALSAATASAQVYVTPGYGYATPVADLAAPGYGAAPTYGYAAPAYAVPAPVYTAPPVYAAPLYAAPPVYAAPAPVYTAPPVVSGYYAAPSAVVSQPIYNYAPGYWGGYGYGWR